jgi:hypothetical protein
VVVAFIGYSFHRADEKSWRGVAGTTWTHSTTRSEGRPARAAAAWILRLGRGLDDAEHDLVLGDED